VWVSLFGLASIAASPRRASQGLPKQDGQCNTLIETQVLGTLPIVRALVAHATTTPSALQKLQAVGASMGVKRNRSSAAFLESHFHCCSLNFPSYAAMPWSTYCEPYLTMR
jgi:hypothetical protein